MRKQELLREADTTTWRLRSAGAGGGGGGGGGGGDAAQPVSRQKKMDGRAGGSPGGVKTREKCF